MSFHLFYKSSVGKYAVRCLCGMQQLFHLHGSVASKCISPLLFGLNEAVISWFEFAIIYTIQLCSCSDGWSLAAHRILLFDGARSQAQEA